MPTSQGKRWCFTINNWEQSDTNALQTLIDNAQQSRLRYIIYSEEVGENGTPHYQGFVIFTSNKRFNWVRAALGGRAHVELAVASSQAAADYCRKEGAHNIVEFGDFPDPPGTRSDLEEFHAWCQALDHRPTARECYDAHPKIFMRYRQSAWDFVHVYQPLPRLSPEGETPRDGWQQELWQTLMGTPDDRSVIFIVDEEGNSGKSWFCKYALTERPDDVQVLRNGKKEDLNYQLDETKTMFLFDIQRSEMQFLQYSVLEALKDRYVLSTKYQPREKRFGPTHVVVMCNEPPDYEKLSADRFDVKNI